MMSFTVTENKVGHSHLLMWKLRQHQGSNPDTLFGWSGYVALCWGLRALENLLGVIGSLMDPQEAYEKF